MHSWCPENAIHELSLNSLSKLERIRALRCPEIGGIATCMPILTPPPFASYARLQHPILSGLRLEMRSAVKDRSKSSLFCCMGVAMLDIDGIDFQKKQLLATAKLGFT